MHIGQDAHYAPVDLLRHRPVMRTQPCLDMHHRHARIVPACAAAETVFVSPQLTLPQAATRRTYDRAAQPSCPTWTCRLAADPRQGLGLGKASAGQENPGNYLIVMLACVQKPGGLP